MKSAFFCLLIMYTGMNATTVKFLRHADGRDINDDFPTNKAILEESIMIGRDNESGCLCRLYLVEEYVTCYDPVLCKRFPKDIHFKTKTIRLSTTGITILSKGDFYKNTQLTTLRLESNDALNRIEPGAFIQMGNLVNLTITHNKNLMYLENDTFTGLVNLTYLKLYKNGFSVLKDFTYSLNPISLPKLRRLIIAQMVFPRIEADDFEAMTNTTVTSLNLFTCKIEYIHPNSLARFKRLKVLGLGENNMSPPNIVEILEMTITNKIPLQCLTLTNLGFKELPLRLLKIVAQTNITHLGLAKNRFEVIEAFPSMSKIERLDLSEVIALNITPNAFQLLPKLSVLFLDGNQFSDVPQAILLPQLTYLDISYSGKYFSLQDEIFANMTNLTYLNLSGNNIRKLAYNSFIGLENMNALGLKESKLFYIENSTFLPMKNLVFLDLRNNPFPTRFLKKSIFSGLDKLEVLLLGECQIAHLENDIFSNLISLKHLGLEMNALKQMGYEVLLPLAQLEILNVSQNYLIAWDRAMLPDNSTVRKFIAFDNKIRNVTAAMVQDFRNLTDLNLHSNPFSCSCDDMTALNNIMYRKNYYKVFDLLNQHQLNCTYPEEYTNQTILDYLHYVSESQVCVEDNTVYSVVNIALLSLILVGFISTTVFVYVYRWHIRYWLFLTKLFLSRSGKVVPHMKKSHTNYEYDAFVSYSNEDQNFVVHLVSMLENKDPYYKLCVYERDFQIGTVISETVLESVAKSRKTLLIVSEAYIKSQWCRWEVQVAENHRLFFENEYGECVNDSLIIVKLGEIQMKNLTPMLKYLMKTRIYLQYDEDPKKQKMFWGKLRNALTKPKTVCNYIRVDI